MIEEVCGNAMEILAEIDTNDAPLVEINVLRAPDRQEFTRIVFFRERGYRDWEREKLCGATYSLVTIDSSYSSELPDVLSRAPETGPVFLASDEPLTLRVFVDRSIVEVFVNGRQCVAMRVYPGREDSVGVSMYARGQDAVLKSLDAWQMQSVYG